MAYNIIRNTRTGYVSMVEKGRDSRGNVKTKSYICGLGSMSIEAFKRFQAWAHGMKNQDDRKAAVLGCKLAVTDDHTKESRKSVISKIEPVVKVKRVMKLKRVDKVQSDKEFADIRKRKGLSIKEPFKPRISKKEMESKDILECGTHTERMIERGKANKRIKFVGSKKDGMNLSFIKTRGKKLRVLNERIRLIKGDIKGAETHIRISEYGHVGVTRTEKQQYAKEYLPNAKEALKILEKQKAELRR